MTADVVIAGAGPAGCVAAVVLARAGARVRLLDRATFPRPKLCGDTVNPGALAILRRLGLTAADAGLPVGGMLVTGPAGVSVDARYRGGLLARAISRADFDHALLACAADAGAAVEEGTLVQGPLVVDDRVAGVRVRGRDGGDVPLAARVVIAADGRESRLARACALARHPARPRRWAVGAYFAGAVGLRERGEMHLRGTHYIGLSPLPGGLANACVVTADRARLRRPAEFLLATIAADRELGPRFRGARMVDRATVLGPLAVDCPAPGVSGLLLAGDAAGFIDPMTGDGLRFAIRGAELAALEALRVLETGASDAHVRLQAARRREFGRKWRVNRALRRLSGSWEALCVAACATRVSERPLVRLIHYAGDLPRAGDPLAA